MALASKTFRIFVSSTFSDMKAERNALQEKVFPRLRELCLQHGTRFQAIDLRWGVREEAALEPPQSGEFPIIKKYFIKKAIESLYSSI